MHAVAITLIQDTIARLEREAAAYSGLAAAASRVERLRSDITSLRGTLHALNSTPPAAPPAITARNVTTPDSADLRIIVSGAADYEEARAAAEALLAASRYTQDATIYAITRDFTGEFTINADY